MFIGNFPASVWISENRLKIFAMGIVNISSSFLSSRQEKNDIFGSLKKMT